jgi:hypothetical protein
MRESRGGSRTRSSRSTISPPASEWLLVYRHELTIHLYAQIQDLATPKPSWLLSGGRLPDIVYGETMTSAFYLDKPLRCVRDFARKQWPLRGSPAGVRCHGTLRSAGD